MRPAKLQTATAIALTAMYLVVGLGGESLHYLVDSAASHLLSSRVTDAEATDTEDTAAEVLAEAAHHHGYHHFHGPDFHVHYHGPVKTKRAPRQASSACQENKQREKNSGASYHEPGRATPAARLSTVGRLLRVRAKPSRARRLVSGSTHLHANRKRNANVRSLRIHATPPAAWATYLPHRVAHVFSKKNFLC